MNDQSNGQAAEEFKVFVGGISWNTTEEGLKKFFEENIDGLELSDDDVKIILDRETGKSRGFGFVTLPDEETLEKILTLDGKELDERTLKINRARPMNK